MIQIIGRDSGLPSISHRQITIPLSNKKVRSAPLWWNEECQKVTNLKMEAEKKFRTFPTSENKIERNKFRAIAKKIYKATH